MGYGLYRGHRYHFWSEGICKGFEPASLVVEVSEIVIDKADEPNPLVGLLDTDGLAGEHLAEIDLLPIEADAAASQKQSADENRRRPPGDSFLLRRSRFSTLAFGAAFWTSSVDLHCAASMIVCQPSSETFASGCLPEKLTSTFRAMTRFNLAQNGNKGMVDIAKAGKRSFIAPQRSHSAHLDRP